MRSSKLPLILSAILALSLVGHAMAQTSDPDYVLSGVGGSMQPDLFTGTAATSIPIEVPPGRHGIQPALSLQYWSGNGDGWLGFGWKLEVGAIQRQTRMGLNYSGDDYTFRLAGVSTDVMSIGSGEYRSKIEGGFSRVKKLTATDGKPYWEATDKKGTRYLFGQTAASRQADPADANKIFKWCLDQVIDTNGNYMTVSYSGYQGQGYLTQIDYTGNGATAPTNTVKFYLETRSDAAPMYTTNFQVITAKRLKTIDVLANGNRVRTYKLSYTASSSISRSLLSSVQQYGKDATLDGTWTVTGGSVLPAPNIIFSGGSFDFPTAMHGPRWGSGWGDPQYYSTIQFADINGDGKLDVCARDAGGIECYLSDGTAFPTAVHGPRWGSGWGDPQYYSTIHFADINGDGKADVCARDAGGIECYLSDGTAFPTAVHGPRWGSGWGDPQYYSTIRFADINGDGKADVCARDAGGIECYLSDGTAFPTAVHGPRWGSGWGDPQYYSTIRFADINGDGKADVCARDAGGIECYLSDGTAFPTAVHGPRWGSGWGDPQYYSTIRFADINGDGKADVCARDAGGIECYLSSGSDFPTAVHGPRWGSGWGDPQYYSTIQFPDINGDGKADVCARDAGGIECYLSSGSDFPTAAHGPRWGSGYSDPQYYSTIRFADDNGDGKADVCSRDAGGIECFKVTEDGLEMLTSISNGLGGTTTLTYKPSTQYTNTQLPFPIQTVSSITTNDGNGNVSTTNYSFSGGFYHIGERDLRGFNYTKVTGPVGPNGEQAINETWFHQGNDLAVAANDPNVADGYMKGKPYRVRVTDGAGHIYSETTTIYTADADGVAPFFNPPLQMDAFTCDGNTCGKQTRSIYTYDSYGNVTREDQYGDLGDSSDDRTIIRAFSPNTTAWIVGLPTSETIYQGIGTSGQVSQTTFYYDGVTSCATASTNQTPTVGNLTRVVRWLNGGTSPETRMAYDAYGNLTCTRDANGNMTTITYDGSFTFSKVAINALSPPQQKTTQYYGVDTLAADNGLYGQVKSVTDPNNAVITTTYDVFGRVSQVNFPDGGWISTSYNSFGTVGSQNIQTNTQVGLSTWKYFDGLGRVTLAKKTGPDSKTIATQTQYNVRGAVSQTSLPYFYGLDSPTWNTLTYDPVGRVLQATHPDSSRTLSCYDDWVTVGVDANNHRKRETRDAYGRLIKVEEYTGTFSVCDTSAGTPYAMTTYQYDVLGNLLGVTDAKGNQTTVQYDSLSRKFSMHDPDMGNWTYVYDPVGNMTQQTDAKSQTIYFRYDVLNRRQQKDYGTQKALGSGDVMYNYDGVTSNGNGRLTSVQDASGSVIFYYDTLGRTTRTDRSLDGTTYVTQTSYDTLSRMLSITYPDNAVVTYTYNGPLPLKAYEGATTYGQYAGYNALGQPGTMTFGNGVVTTYTYSNSSNTVCTQQNFRPCTIKTVLGANPAYQDLRYSYDSGGNIATITDPVNGNQTFVYDELSRLTSAAGPYGSHAYSYNEIGNLLSNPLAGSYTYPTSGGSSVRPHAVSTAGSNSYGYDNNGNMTSGPGRTFTYNFENRPTSITSGGVTTTMVYDGDGGRVKKIAGTLTVRYIGKLYECDNATCVKYIFVGDKRIAVKQVTNGLVDYYHQDHLGSSSVVTTATGVVEENITYYPFGATFTNTGTADVPYKYTGQEFDSSTGLYFYGARYYDATLGRFVGADTVVPSAGDPQSLNRYSYVRNNPLIFVDPTGQRFLGSIGGFLDTLFIKPFSNPSVAIGFFLQQFDPLMGTVLLARSEQGRNVIAGEIIVGTAVATYYCAGCGGAAMGGLLGALSGEVMGGYSAYQAGGNILSGVVVGGVVGGASGYLGGSINTEVGSLMEQAAKNFTAGAIKGFGTGIASGYAGGKGDAQSIVRGAFTSALYGGAISAAKPFVFGVNITSDPNIQGAIKHAETVYGKNFSDVVVREGGLLSGLGPHDAITIGNLVNIDAGMSVNVIIHTMGEELAHVMQYQERGVAGFLIQYGMQASQHSYSQIPLEEQAKGLRDFPFCPAVCR